MTDLPKIQAIYTDGACSGNPGPGGWGTVVYFVDGSVQELGGRAADTTNNRMEMQAAIAALELLNQQQYHAPVELHTDSKYLIQGITQWLRGWKRKGWKTASGKAVLNQDLWQQLDTLNQELQNEQNVEVSWNYVKGHAGNIGNERCDTIARAFSQGQPVQLRQRTASSKAASSPAAADKPTAKKSKPAASSQTPSKQNSVADLAAIGQTLQLLKIADELAQAGYLITTAEVAQLTGLSATDIDKKGQDWTWRNWSISLASDESEGFWQLERLGD